MDRLAGSTDQSVSFAAFTTATGAAVTVTAATAGLSLWYRRGNVGAKMPITPSNLAAIDSAHADGGLIVIEGQDHRLDLPDAAFAAGVDYLEWGGSATGITIDGGSCNLIGQPTTGSVGTPLTSAQTQTAAAAAIEAAEPIRANAVEIGGVSVEPADISQDVRDAMELESTSGEDSIDDKLNAINNEISGTGGIYTQTVTVKTTDGVAIPNATVAIYSGSVLIDTKTTNASGVAQPTCDANPAYTLRVTATGYASYSAALAVTGDATLADIVLTSLASSIPLPDDSRQCTGYGYVYDETGNVATDADICCKMTKEPSGSGIILENAKRTETSSATGLVTFTRLWIGATYYFYRDGSEKGFTVTVREASVTEDGLFPLPNFIG